MRISTEKLIDNHIDAAQQQDSPGGFDMTKGELQSMIKQVRARGSKPNQVDASDRLLIEQAWNDRLGAGFYATVPARNEFSRQQAKGFAVGRQPKV